MYARKIPPVHSCLHTPAVHVLVRKGVVVASTVLWMGTKALISIFLCFTIVSFLEYPCPMMCPFCYFICVATCSL